MFTLGRVFFSLLSALLFYSQPSDEPLRTIAQEKQAYLASPAKNWHAPNLLKKIDALTEKAKQSFQAQNVTRGNALAQQTRWLIPDPNMHLPDHVSRVLGSLKFKHEGAICAVLYLPDGRTLLTASQDGTVRHWDSVTGRAKTSWDVGKPLGPLAISPDEKWIAVAEGYRPSTGFDPSNMNLENEHTIHIYELATGHERWKLAGHGKNAVLCLAFSPDSKRLASGCQIGLGGNDGIKVWSVETGKEETPPQVSYGINALAWSSDGEQLFAAQTNNSLAVVSLRTGFIVRSLPREADKIYTIALSPDGATLAMAGEIKDSDKWVIRLYSTKTWTASNLLAHRSAISALTFQRDGKTLISASAKPEAAIRVWDIGTKTQTALYQGHSDDVMGVALRLDGKEIATVSLDHSIRLWQAAHATSSKVIARHQGPVWQVIPGAADKQFLTVSADQSAAIWDYTSSAKSQTSEPAPKVKYLEHHAPVLAGAYRPDFEEVATGGGDQIIRLWNPNTGQTNASLSGHTGIITSLCYSPDGKRLYSGSSDRTVKAWDLATKKVTYTLPQHRSVVTCVALNLDGSLLASGGADNVVRLCHAADGKEVKALVGHTAAVTALSFSPGGQLLTSVGADGRVIIWDAQTGTNLRPKTQQGDQLMTLAFSGNSKYLATGGADDIVRIWNVESGEEIRVLQGHTDWITSVTFLHEDEALISASVDGTVRSWEQSEPSEIPSYGHAQSVVALAMSPRGDRLASGSEDGQIMLWDPETGNDLRTFAGHRAGIVSLAFSSDGKLLLAGDREQRIRLWDVETGKELQALSAGNTVLRVGFVGNDRGVDVGLGNGEVIFWKFAEKEPRLLIPDPACRLPASDQSISAYSIQQTTVALGTKDGNATLWHVPENLKPESRQRFQCYPEAVQDLAMHANGTRLLSVNAESLFKWWDTGEKKELKSWKGRPAKPIKLALHPSSNLALISFQSNELVLWDAAAGKELRSWKFRGPIHDLAFASEAKRAFAASSSGVIYQLDLP